MKLTAVRDLPVLGELQGIFRWRNAKLLFEALREVRLIIKANEVSDLCDGIGFSADQIGSTLQPDVFDKIVGRHSGECLQLSEQLCAAQVHLVSHFFYCEGAIAEVCFDHRPRPVQEFVIQ